MNKQEETQEAYQAERASSTNQRGLREANLTGCGEQSRHWNRKRSGRMTELWVCRVVKVHLRECTALVGYVCMAGSRCLG
jgi:hypothetical protein